MSIIRIFSWFVRVARIGALALALPLVLSACAARFTELSERPAPLPDVKTGQVQLVVFRPFQIGQGGINYQVDINGQRSAFLPTTTFVVIDATLGSLRVDTHPASAFQRFGDSQKGTIDLNVAPNERVFLWAGASGTVTGFGVSSSISQKRFIARIPEIEALKEIQRLKLAPKDEE